MESGYMGTTLKVILGLILGVVAIILFVCVIKSGHWFKSIMLTALSGFAALLAVNLLGMVSDVVIPINAYTLVTSCVLGIPGTILTLAVMATFLK